MGKKFQYDRAAEALALAHFMTDAEAGGEVGVSERSVQRYRKRAREDRKLAGSVVDKLQELRETRDWAEGVEEALSTALSAARQCMNQMDKSNPETLAVINEHLDVVLRHQHAKRLIDSKLNG
jgi:predicted RNA-binding protein (virulence factor B family)